MASGKQTDVTLRIRARNEAQAALEKTLAALEDSKKALEAFNASSKKQGRTTAELREEQDKLNAALAKLKSAASGASGLKTLQEEAAKVAQRFKDAQASLQTLLAAQANGAAKSDAAGRKQEAAIARQRSEIKQLAAEQENLNRIIASAPANLGRRVAARELSLTRAADSTGAQVENRGATLAARQASLEESRRINEKSKFNGLVQRETELRKQTLGVMQQQNAAAARAASEEARTTEAVRKGAAARREAAAAQKGLDKNGAFAVQRTSLDLTQRLRGQVLSLTASYVGLFSVIDQVNKALDEQRRMNAVQSRLSVAFDTTDTQALGDELQFVQGESRRLSLDFLQLAESYSKFAAAAKLAGASSAEVRTVFTALAESSRGLGLSTQQVERVFTAVEQIYSKTIVSTEELKGQLGESLAGAFEAFAQESGRSSQQLIADLQSGSVAAGEFANFITGYADKATRGLAASLDTVDAKLVDFGNTTREIRGEFSEGLESGLKDSLVELTKALADPAAKESARELGQAIGDALRVIVHYRGEIAQLIAAYVGFKTVSFAVTFMLDFYGSTVKLLEKSAPVLAYLGNLAKFLRLVGQASVTANAGVSTLGAGVAGLMGYGVGTWAYDSFEAIRKLGVVFVGLAEAVRLNVKAIGALLTHDFSALASIGAEVKTVGENLKTSWNSAGDEAGNTADAATRAAEATKKAAAAAAEQKRELEQTQAVLEANTSTLDKSLVEARSSLAAEMLDEEGKKVAEVEAKYAELGQNIQRNLSVLEKTKGVDPAAIDAKKQEVTSELAKQEAQKQAAIAAVRQEFRDKEAKDAESAREKRAQEEQRLADTLSTIEQNALQATADTLAEKEALIVNKYAQIYDQLNSSKATTAQKKRIGALVEQAKQMELMELRAADATEKHKLAEEALNTAVEARDAAIQVIGARVTAGQLSEAEGAEKIRQIYAASKDEIIRLAEELLKLPGLTEAQRLAVEKLKVETAGAGLEGQKLGVTAAQAADMFASGMTEAIDGFVSGTKSAQDAFREFAADFLRQIALMIIKQQILNALKSMGGGAGGFASLFAHTGGVIGTGTFRRSKVDPAVFMGAPKYHTGGIAGLAPNEVPAILKKGEEVITETDPRHASNGGGGGASQPQNVQVINTIDSAAMQDAVFSGAGAAKQIVNIVRANRSAFNQALVGG